MRSMKLKAAVFAGVLSGLLVGPAAAASLELKMGNEGTFPPFSIVDASGQLSGLEPELARELCQRLDATCDIRAMEFKALLPSLISGKIDVIVSQLFPKPERLEKTEFTAPVLVNPNSWAVPHDWSDAITPDTLDGKAIGTIKGSWYLAAMKDWAKDADIKQYENIEQIRLDLLAGRLDLAIGGKLNWIRILLDAEGGDQWKLVDATEPLVGTEAYSWAVQKGNVELRDKINTALADIFADCTYSEIRKRYFSEPTSDQEPAGCQ